MNPGSLFNLSTGRLSRWSRASHGGARPTERPRTCRSYLRQLHSTDRHHDDGLGHTAAGHMAYSSDRVDAGATRPPDMNRHSP